MSEPTTLNTTTTIQYLSQKKGYELLDMEADTSLQSTPLQKKGDATANS